MGEGVKLREYQQAAIDAVLSYWRTGGGNPLVELATGLGKSVVIAELNRLLFADYPGIRALMLVHVKELVEQNYKAMTRVWPAAPVGIYSAGLGLRQFRDPIIFASVQSVYKKADVLGDRALVEVDECHLIPKDGEGMYRTLLEGLRLRRPDLRLVGFTATPFRLGSGRLDEGDDRLFDKTVFTYGIGDGIRDGWLTPLISKRGATEIDTSGVKKVGGEYVAGALEAAADVPEVTKAAAADMVARGEGRRSWLVFCCGIIHAHNVAVALRAHGISAGVVTGKTSAGDRARMFADFRAGRLRALCGANIFTTGFDAPGVDLIAFLRPTQSVGLYLQMVGRGVRLVDPAIGDKDDAAERVAAIAASIKPNCMVLDFAGNVRRHGPVDAVNAPKPRRKGMAETVCAKECPACMALVGLSTRTCQYCGHEFEVFEKGPNHEAEADDAPIMSSEVKDQRHIIPVVQWAAARHEKEGGRPSMCVTHFAALVRYREWVCFEHTGFAKHKAERWWVDHGGQAPVPATVDEAMQRFSAGEVAKPTRVEIRREGKYDAIAAYIFDKEPVGEAA